MAIVGRITVDMFFDAPAVQRDLRRRDRRYLARSGAFVRSVARNSMKRRANADLASDEGSPPFDHDGPLRRLLLFGFDRGRGSVVIGFLAFPGSNVPELHEDGGTTTIEVPGSVREGPKRRGPVRDRRGRFLGNRRRSPRRRRRRRGRRVRARYPARPTVGPALEFSASKLPEFWD